MGKYIRISGIYALFELASVCGRRAEKVKRRRRDGGNGVGAQRRRRAADGSPPLLRPTIAARDERAVLRSGTGVVERDTGRRAARGAQQTARWSRRIRAVLTQKHNEADVTPDSTNLVDTNF